jgi:hypothetical protein
MLNVLLALLLLIVVMSPSGQQNPGDGQLEIVSVLFKAFCYNRQLDKRTILGILADHATIIYKIDEAKTSSN